MCDKMFVYIRLFGTSVRVSELSYKTLVLPESFLTLMWINEMSAGGGEFGAVNFIKQL